MKRGSHTSGSAEKKRSPWLLLLAAVALVLIFDAAVFHSRLYTRVLKPDSYAGLFNCSSAGSASAGIDLFRKCFSWVILNAQKGFPRNLLWNYSNRLSCPSIAERWAGPLRVSGTT